MKQRTASRLAWAILGFGVAVFAVAAWLAAKAHTESQVLPFLPILLSFGGVGALVAIWATIVARHRSSAC